MSKFIFDEDKIKDPAILAKVKRYQAIVHAAANESREFTPSELRDGSRLLKELIQDGVMAWWDQGLESFVEDFKNV